MPPYSQAPGADDPIDQIRHWLALVGRQWLPMALVWILIVAGAGALVEWWPRKYTSTAKFLVRNARQDLVVNPSGGPASASASRSDVSEETLNSEIELLKSRDLLERVVRDLRLTTPLQPGEDESRALERAVGALRNDLEIGPIRKTNLIRVALEAHDPEQAASVLRHLVQTYLSVHLTVHSSPGTYEFFKEQTAISKVKLDEAQAELTALARRADLIVPDEQRRAALQAASAMEAELTTLEAQIGEQASRARSSEMQMTSTNSRIVTEERRMPNQPSVERLHTLIAELKNKRTQLLTKFNATDRLVLEVNEQLANTEAALKEASALKATEEATGLNPSWQTLQTEQVNANLALAGLSSKAARVRKQLAEYRSRAITLTEAAPQYEALGRQVAEARNEYESYAKRTEEARIAEALDKQKISNVVLTEAPVASHVPSTPRAKLAMLLAGVVATFLAVGVGVVAEWRWGIRQRRRAEAAEADAYMGMGRRVADAGKA